MQIEELRKKRAEKARKYRAKHKEKYNTYNRERWKTKRSLQYKKQTHKDKTCRTCDILLASKYGANYSREYCKMCIEFKHAIKDIWKRATQKYRLAKVHKV